MAADWTEALHQCVIKHSWLASKNQMSDSSAAVTKSAVHHAGSQTSVLLCYYFPRRNRGGTNGHTVTFFNISWKSCPQFEPLTFTNWATKSGACLYRRKTNILKMKVRLDPPVWFVTWRLSYTVKTKQEKNFFLNHFYLPEIPETSTFIQLFHQTTAVM